MAHHEDANKRLGEIKTTLNRLNKNSNEKAKFDFDPSLERVKPQMLGSSGALGVIGPAGISLVKGLIQKFKGSFRTGAKEIAKDQAISAGLDLFNR